MIPVESIKEWGRLVPWTGDLQLEHDLIISRALVGIFSCESLRQQLLFRGGTALNKIHFPGPFRFSEDIDLVRTVASPTGPFVEELREALEPWLGKGKYKRSPIAPKLFFRVPATVGRGNVIKLKIEVNKREIEASDPTCEIGHAVENPWFSGEASIPTYSREEILASKLKAFLQRDKGRDLFDLNHSLRVFEDLDVRRMVDIFCEYPVKHEREKKISKAQAQARIYVKLDAGNNVDDVKDLLAPEFKHLLTDREVNSAFRNVLDNIIELLPGNPWARLDDLMEILESGS